MNYLDVAKVITCFLVVIGHICRRYSLNDWLGFGVHNIYISWLASYIYSFHMPLFFMISGYVYEIQLKKSAYSYVSNKIAFIQKKINRLIVPYFCFSIPLTAVLYFVGRFQGSIFENYFNAFLITNNTYLWFLPCLFVISILYNSLGLVIRRWSFLCLLVLAGFSVSSDYLPNYLQINNVARYSFYYSIGVIAQNFETKLLKMFTLKNAVVLFMVQSIFYYMAMKTWGYVLIHSVLALICALLGSFLVLIVSFLISRESILRSGLVESLVKDSYSVYLIHSMLIYILYFYIFKASSNCYVQFLLAILLSYSISMLVACILRRVNGSWIIGEKNVK